MSDSEGDIDDELLELAGATERKRKKRQAEGSKSSKRRKASSDDEDSDAEQPESEEEDAEANPYPLEGKYVDELDRQRLLELPEIEREDILAERQEEMQRIQDKRNLDQMLKAQSGRGDDTVSKAAKRQHAQRGATKEKTRKLDELKAKRRAKDEKKRTRGSSPKREMSSSPVDMEMSDEEEEDGQISKYEEQEEKERKLYDRYDKPKTDKDPEEPATLEALERCRVSRDMIARYCMAPWFEEFLKGAWVRFLIGNEEDGQAVYRICEVTGIGQAPRPYKLNDKLYNKDFHLKHGQSLKNFLMDKVSNSPFISKEFDRLTRTCELERVKLPSRLQLEKKAAQLEKFIKTPMTESDIAAMLLARKNMMGSLSKTQQTSTSITMERSRLVSQRTLATRRQDWAEVKLIDEKLAELAATAPVRVSNETRQDILAKVNERNRKANLEAVRKAETAEAERKRRERKLLAAGGGTPRSSTPADPAARLKANLLSSRPGTPGTPFLQADTSTPRSISPLPPDGSPKAPEAAGSFEASIMQSVEIDLGDF
ncbi:hypothetical protein POSPLADRAFT_1062251 [Postia placenta MAD-698-R-SB12]|uniref:Plus3 domain-containing protein n=1 Tax=Postia placenta MAD-698-R-SB12 TaxID=670580 RepID=A0A1X6MK95_9APHY|nr:hypothetical protein POSPLADRAFT_1062251 [Postia placenta MAD-698-R-SB12]OSX56775.1 hypothetical protein POSPLADRAFT_1062251 [Postia placenta MAD-698-R-SB12]